MTKRDQAQTAAQKLQALAAQLRQGEHFSITRLTILKRLCAEPGEANAFALHIAQLTQCAVAQGVRPRDLDEARWQEYRKRMDAVIQTMDALATTRTVENSIALARAVHELAHMQSHTVRVSWNIVREIEYTEAYRVELAGQCVLDSAQAGYWSYQLARAYAERYDPRYGTGLIPDSAPMVEQIAEFFAQRTGVEKRE